MASAPCLLDHLVVGRRYRITLVDPGMWNAPLVGRFIRHHTYENDGVGAWFMRADGGGSEWIALDYIAHAEEVP